MSRDADDEQSRLAIVSPSVRNSRRVTAFAGRSRAGQPAIAGRLTVGSSLNGAEPVLHPFDLELEASTSLLELEKMFPDDDIVLVGADSIAEVTSAFRNYFRDVRDFLQLMHVARDGFGLANKRG